MWGPRFTRGATQNTPVAVNLYVLPTGSDYGTCGWNVSTACATLPRLLSVMEQHYKSPPQVFRVVTGTSAVINEIVMVS